MGGSGGLEVVTGGSRVDGCVVLFLCCKGESCRYIITRVWLWTGVCAIFV